MSESDIRYYLIRAAQEERRAREAGDPTIRKTHAKFAVAYRVHIYALMARRVPPRLRMVPGVPTADAHAAGFVPSREEFRTRDAVSI